MAIFLHGMVAALPLAPFLVRVFFGREFASAPLLTAAGLGIGFVQALRVLFSITLKVENNPGASGANEIIGTGLTFALMIPFVGSIGILGAPLASACGGAIALGLTIRRIGQLYEASLVDIVLPHRGDFQYLLQSLGRRSSS
jgi:O-antigen/teichoic acid export membrane protein